jgi:hypothetical protein
MSTQKVKWTFVNGKWIREIQSGILSQNVNAEGTESPDKDSEEPKAQEKVSEEKDVLEIESQDIDPEDKQIYEGNLENVPSITQSEIRIFLSSTFKGKLFKTLKISLI